MFCYLQSLVNPGRGDASKRPAKDATGITTNEWPYPQKVLEKHLRLLPISQKINKMLYSRAKIFFFPLKNYTSDICSYRVTVKLR